MNKPLCVLQVEDSEPDAELLVRILGGAGYEVDSERVENAGDMRRALAERAWDVVIADYRLPRFSAPAALEVLRETGQDIPFIVVSGAVGEDVAVETMRLGAHDYLLKNSLTRLAAAVDREIGNARMRRQQREREERLVKELERSNADLQAYAYTVSHDLREPLRMVSCYVDLIERRCGSRLDEESREFMDIVTASVQRMSDMLRGLLEFSRAGQARLTMSAIDGHVLINEAIDSLALEIRDAHRADSRLDELAYHFAEGALAGDPLKAVDYGRRAGERADAELAFESAAKHYDRALGALELVDAPDPALRCDLQIALAVALFNAGDSRRRDAVFAAAASASAMSDGERLARAAVILASGPGPSDGRVDQALVDLLEAALAAVPAENAGLRAQVLSCLAVEIQWSEQRDRQSALAHESLTLARESRDQKALSLALARSWSLIDATKPYLDEMQALSEEAESVARDSGDPNALRSALHNLAVNAGCRGDGQAFVTYAEEVLRITDALRRPHLHWVARNFDAALAAYRGDLDRAERLATEALDLARIAAINEEATMGVFGSLLYQVRTAQGRVGELITLLEARVENAPGTPVWRIALAGALLESDRLDEARVHHLWLADNECANVPRDIEYPVTMCGLGRQTYRLRPPEPIIRDVYERLLPFERQFNWSGACMSDPSGLGLALAAAALDRPDDSDRHFADVIALCEHAGARSYLARCHFHWTMVLADRGDATRAREQGEITIALGTELGMTGPQGVVPRAEAILAGL